MKIYKLAAFVAVALFSCSREPRESGGLVQRTITAGIEGRTKTELAADDASQVMWSVGDQVDVWVEETAYEFTSKVTETDLYSTFEGIAPADMDKRTWVLVYPKGASTGKDGSIVSATLPATQTARANSYDPSAALLYGASQGSNTTCKHLYSGIRLMFTQTGIRRVSLRGNAGEKIAGDFTFNCSDGTIGSGTSETIVLNAPDGGTFEAGTWYYVLCLPTVFSRGITITADNGSQAGYFTTETSTTFTRSIIKNKADLAIGNWADIGTAGTVHYGPANSFCLQAGSSTAIGLEKLPCWPLSSKDEFSTQDNDEFKTFKYPRTNAIFKDIETEGDVYADVVATRLSSQLINGNIERRYYGQSAYYTKQHITPEEVDNVQYVSDPEIFVPFDVKEQRLYDPIVPDFVVTVQITTKSANGFFVTNTLRFVPKIQLISYKDIDSIASQANSKKSSMTGPAGVTVKYSTMDQLIKRLADFSSAVKQ